jgi:ubiquinone/menaquinone biosynthesis C-methylase UbiE
LYGETSAVSKNISRLRRGGLLKHLKKHDLVLDLFCGKCETGHGLKRMGYDRVICGDHSIRLLKTKRTGLVTRVCLDALNLPVKEQSVDVVIIQGGLHHLQSTQQILSCLNGLKKIVNPDGYVFLSEPGNTVLLGLWLLLMTKTPFWKLSKFSRNWHDLHSEEKATHEDYLTNLSKVHGYIKTDWKIVRYKKGLVTDFFLLKNGTSR